MSWPRQGRNEGRVGEVRAAKGEDDDDEEEEEGQEEKEEEKKKKLGPRETSALTKMQNGTGVRGVSSSAGEQTCLHAVPPQSHQRPSHDDYYTHNADIIVSAPCSDWPARRWGPFLPFFDARRLRSVDRVGRLFQILFFSGDAVYLLRRQSVGLNDRSLKNTR